MRQSLSLFPLIAILAVVTTGCQQKPSQDVLDQPREAILQHGAGAIPVLEEALGDDDALVRGKAAVRLGLWAGHKGDAKQKEAAIESLGQALQDDQPGAQLEVLAGLAEIGPEAIPTIAKGLEHEDPQVRAQAVDSVLKAAQGGAVVSSLEPETFAAMKTALDEAFLDDESLVRARVVYNIGWLGTRGTTLKFIPVQDTESQLGPESQKWLIDTLQKGLNDEAPEVCRDASVSVWQFGPEKGPMLEKTMSGENAAARSGVLLSLAELPLTEEIIGRIMPAFFERDQPSEEELAATLGLFERGFEDKDLFVRLAAADAAITLEPDTLRPSLLADIGLAADSADSALWSQKLRKLTDHVAQKGTLQQKTEIAIQLEDLLRKLDEATAVDMLVVFSKLGPGTLPVVQRILESDRVDMHAMAVGCVVGMFDSTRRGYDSGMYMTAFGPQDEATAMGVLAQAIEVGDLDLQLLAAETGKNLKSQAPPAGIVSAMEKALRAEDLDVAKQLPRILSIAVYVGAKGEPDQKAAILQALTDVAADAKPEVASAVEAALDGIPNPKAD